MNDQVLKDYEEYKAQGRIWGGVPPERIARIKFPRIDKKIIEEFLALDDLTGSISDVLDTLGINGAIPASYLAPLLPGSKIAGTAITLRSIPERKTATKGLIDKDYIRMATRDTPARRSNCASIAPSIRKCHCSKPRFDFDASIAKNSRCIGVSG